MEERLRSGEHSGVVKNRIHSGCLIVRKKGDGSGGAGSAGTREIHEPKTYKRRSRMIMCDSGSSDELVMPPRSRAGMETIQVCNGLAAYEESEIGRKRSREERVRPSDKGLFGWNGEDLSESKRSRLEVFDFDEYDGLEKDMIMRRSRFNYGGEEVGGRRLSGSMPAVGRMSIEREYESGPSRHAFHEKKKKNENLYFDKSEGMSWGDHDDRNRFRKDRDGTLMHYPLLRERYMADSDEPIRVQGKNGVLKVMVNKKKKVFETLKNVDHLEAEEGQRGSRIDDRIRRNLHACSSLYSDTEVLEKPVSFGRKEKRKTNMLTTPTTMKNMVTDSDSEDSDTFLKLRPKGKETSNRKKKVRSKEEKDQVEQLQPTRIKEGKNRRGCGTEKQKLRERIREMLQEAGWTIDYRPRRNRDYLDAVYINPAGTAYWSIIKAYDALQKQLDEGNLRKPSGDGPAFTPLSDEVLSQLTRKTGKKMKREVKNKRKDESGSEDAQEPDCKKSSSTRHEDESMDSLSHEEKLSSLMKSKSMKRRMNYNHAFSGYAKGQKSLQVHDSYEKTSSISNYRHIHGRKSRKLGRCTLLVRGSNVAASSVGDDFVPYYGKRTLLAWLIDSEVVQLSQKVRYMNRRRTKVMLEGWITGDGIHCVCCSKILTVSKFEIHAGSKLRQPFQNIYLDTGVSLLQCQIDAWNRQVESEQIGFHSVDVNGDDPNDDTCGICGDGGDLICCDSCPSTFHQSCLNIEFLPAGDWHCPNCICKFCGNDSSIAQEDDVTVCVLLTCSLCEKRYHESCIKVTNEIHIDSNLLVIPFCGKTCRELFEHLQKYLGVKHELEGGFSWSLIRRTESESDICARGLPQRVECNSKLAVALTVMDECFLPIVDRRSGINIVNNVVYNCGSNFNRLNYGGFYTVILERGDEIISAASIRFHGIQLAEMPFIGTRHAYRHQGMFRWLFCAIESALRSLKVHKLVIPAIAEVTPTWTGVFGFTALEDSVKQEMRSMNMLVFPGIDMLQKFLLKLENTTSDAGAKLTEPISNEQITPEVANGSKPGSSSGNDTDGDLNHSGRINGETRVTDSNSQCPNVSVNDTCGTRGSSDASPEPNDETTLMNNQTDTRNVSRADIKYDAHPSPSHDTHEMQNKAGLDYPAEDNQSDDRPDSRSGNKAIEPASDSENVTTSMDNNEVDQGNKTASDFAIEKNIRSREEREMEAVDAGNNVDVKTKLAVEETTEMEMKKAPGSPDEQYSQSSKRE
ncbi:Imidazoleglycerol-phosphate dehydratase [Hibiscus syriacus]|uniref:Imidazoleglycerol-phosphate dehydratase n=1 Tax=Hibiscus syriacus TaxID=106335 RepID=A0A6A3CXK6_HIBSY|nr:Imidazoleglycerol-phosphate dehydratase [Hibiscus syriacus]